MQVKRKISILSIFTVLFLLLGLVCGGNISYAASSNKLNVHFINVGQGDAIYIKTPQGENILIDAGNRSGSTVVSYLKKQNVKTIDYMIATHPDADHIGGLDEVLDAFDVKNIYAPKVSHTTQAYKDFLNAVKREKRTIKTAKAGVTLPINKAVQAKFIAPVKDYAKSDLNNWSAVLQVKYNKNTFLFAGDAEIKSEKDMLSKNYLSKVDVLKVGHHGAKEATSTEFLNKVKPTYAVISVGKGNNYKHPTTDTLNRLKAVKTKVYRTDTQGTIIATSDGKNITFNIKPAADYSKTTTYKLSASLDNRTPKQYATINLNVTGLPKGTNYKAVFRYKSTTTTYNGKVGTNLPVKISRAAKGYTVKVDITATYNNKTYTAQTSFTPK